MVYAMEVVADELRLAWRVVDEKLGAAALQKQEEEHHQPMLYYIMSNQLGSTHHQIILYNKPTV